jgi:CheY-like chemotaxis protein
VSKPSVLIVEDDEQIRETLGLILELEGYSVRSAANGQEALALLRESPTSLIILDLMMPVMSGWEFLAEREKEESLAAIPVVVMTAGSRSDERPRNINAFLSKPVELEELLGTVSQLI